MATVTSDSLRDKVEQRQVAVVTEAEVLGYFCVTGGSEPSNESLASMRKGGCLL